MRVAYRAGGLHRRNAATTEGAQIMKAYELVPREGLKLVGRPSPEVGPSDVRIRTRAVSLNYRRRTSQVLVRAADA